MAQQTINVGTAPNDGTGTPLRTAFQYTNSNFSELYTAVGPSGNNIVVPGNATITGDLTVDTSTLKVDSANNYVGIGTASPAQKLHLENQANSCFIRTGSTQNSAGFDFGVGGTGDSTAYIYNRNNTPIVFGINATEQMRLNSTGLGIGGNNPFSKLHIQGTSQAGCSMTMLYTGIQTAAIGIKSNGSLTLGLDGGTGTTDRLLIDTSGNVGIGVTPSAWSIYKGLQVGYASLAGYAGFDTVVGANMYFDGTNFKYIASLGASSYRQIAAGHQWFTAASGTAGTTITDFATAKMTLDASGNLGVGVTPSAWGSGFKALEFPYASFFVNSLVNGNPNVAANFFYNASAQPIYKSNGFASAYSQYNGAHSWAIAPSGTAGNVITFNTAMTLDASGNLLVGSALPVSGGRISGNSSTGPAGRFFSSAGDNQFAAMFDKSSATNTTSQWFIGFTINNQSTGSGQINANGASQAAFGTFSDSRLKENIVSLPSQLANILSLRPVEFDYKDGSGHQIGFVAQEMQEVYSDTVSEQNGFLTVTGWSKTEARLVSAIKELAAKVQALEAKLA